MVAVSFTVLEKGLSEVDDSLSTVYTPRVTLTIFRALQTSRVLHISINARWRMNFL